MVLAVLLLSSAAAAAPPSNAAIIERLLLKLHAHGIPMDVPALLRGDGEPAVDIAALGERPPSLPHPLPSPPPRARPTAAASSVAASPPVVPDDVRSPAAPPRRKTLLVSRAGAADLGWVRDALYNGWDVVVHDADAASAARLTAEAAAGVWGPRAAAGALTLVDRAQGGSVEAVPYLRYIVDAYDRLPDVVLFAQGRPTERGVDAETLAAVLSCSDDVFVDGYYASINHNSNRDHQIGTQYDAFLGDFAARAAVAGLAHVLPTTLDGVSVPIACCAQFLVTRKAIQQYATEWWRLLLSAAESVLLRELDTNTLIDGVTGVLSSALFRNQYLPVHFRNNLWVLPNNSSSKVCLLGPPNLPLYDISSGRLGNKLFSTLGLTLIAARFGLRVEYSYEGLQGFKDLGLSQLVYVQGHCLLNQSLSLGELPDYAADILTGVCKSCSMTLTDGSILKSTDTDVHGTFSHQYFQSRSFATYVVSVFLPAHTKQLFYNNPYKHRCGNGGVFIHLRLGDIKDTSWFYTRNISDYLETIHTFGSRKEISIASDSLYHPLVKNLILQLNAQIIDMTPMQTIQFGATAEYLLLSDGTFSWWIGAFADAMRCAKEIHYFPQRTTWHGDIFVSPHWIKHA